MASSPKLRSAIDIQRVQIQGEWAYLLRDMAGFSDERALIPEILSPFLFALNGELSIEDLFLVAAEHEIPEEYVHQLISELDRCCLLDTPTIRERERNINKLYLESPDRPAALVGKVYSSHPDICMQELQQWVDQNPKIQKSKKQLIALMCPHIDYGRGGFTYGTTFRQLEAGEKPETIILIGTSHQAGNSRFILTNKNFQTPLGTFDVDRDAIAQLAKRGGGASLYRDEILHRSEHSLELQLPFLGMLWKGQPLPKIVPILVGSFYDFLQMNRLPEEEARTADFIHSLAELIRDLRLSGKQALVYAGVDLSHLGQQFGDEGNLSKEIAEQAELRDREFVDALLRADERAIFEHVACDLDSRRICGYPSLYSMLAALRRAGVQMEGELYDYRQAIDYRAECFVSFASAGWREV